MPSKLPTFAPVASVAGAGTKLTNGAVAGIVILVLSVVSIAACIYYRSREPKDSVPLAQKEDDKDEYDAEL